MRGVFLSLGRLQQIGIHRKPVHSDTWYVVGVYLCGQHCWYYMSYWCMCVCVCVSVCKNNNKKIFSPHYCQSNRPHTAADVPEHHCKHNWNAVSKNLFDFMCQVCAMAKGQGLVLCNYVKVRTGYFFSFCLCPHHPRAHAFTLFGIITTTNNTIAATAINDLFFFYAYPSTGAFKIRFITPRVFFAWNVVPTYTRLCLTSTIGTALVR